MNGMGKRLARLETQGGVDDLLPLALLDDLVGSLDLVDWPEDVAGVRMVYGKPQHWLRSEAEALCDFRRRVSVELGERGPAGALPHIVSLIAG